MQGQILYPLLHLFKHIWIKTQQKLSKFQVMKKGIPNLERSSFLNFSN